MAGLNFLLFHRAFFRYVFTNIDYMSFNGIMLIVSVVLLVFFLNAFLFYLFLFLSRPVGKGLLVLVFMLNAFAVYFVATYNAIIDESMIGNFYNTNYEEASAFVSWKLFLYLILLGIVPSIYIIRVRLVKERLKRFLIISGICILSAATLGLVNAPNWLWIDKNATSLGGLLMPWSYSVNSALYLKHKKKRNQAEILLPEATLIDGNKKVLVLMIGESARRANFSLYGYEKDTNPRLAATSNLQHYEVASCATYTTAALRCILSHSESGEPYEVLPNYLHRAGVDVVWRTTNSGEPPIRIEEYHNRQMLSELYACENEDYDGILLAGLGERIAQSENSKVLIILHMSTSHGPTYSKCYPPEFERFTPVCHSVELGNCTQEELINAYDNTIVYTDYLVHQTIEVLAGLEECESALIFLSDHGESLGEKNLYMHGVPMSIAPREQYEIPFIVWLSDSTRRAKQNIPVTQTCVFHSVLSFLGVESPIYEEEKNIFE